MLHKGISSILNKKLIRNMYSRRRGQCSDADFELLLAMANESDSDVAAAESDAAKKRKRDEGGSD